MLSRVDVCMYRLAGELIILYSWDRHFRDEKLSAPLPSIPQEDYGIQEEEAYYQQDPGQQGNYRNPNAYTQNTNTQYSQQ
jgi:hypothetical protein